MRLSVLLAGAEKSRAAELAQWTQQHASHPCPHAPLATPLDCTLRALPLSDAMSRPRVLISNDDGALRGSWGDAAAAARCRRRKLTDCPTSPHRHHRAGPARSSGRRAA